MPGVDRTRIRDHARTLTCSTDPAARLTGRYILRLLAETEEHAPAPEPRPGTGAEAPEMTDLLSPEAVAWLAERGVEACGDFPFGVLCRMARSHAVAHALVQEQAEDDGLWFVARTAPEAYLQQELRRLHAAIEGA